MRGGEPFVGAKGLPVPPHPPQTRFIRDTRSWRQRDAVHATRKTSIERAGGQARDPSVVYLRRSSRNVSIPLKKQTSHMVISAASMQP